jgi:hypothetical protein
MRKKANVFGVSRIPWTWAENYGVERREEVLVRLVELLPYIAIDLD